MTLKAVPVCYGQIARMSNANLISEIQKPMPRRRSDSDTRQRQRRHLMAAELELRLSGEVNREPNR